MFDRESASSPTGGTLALVERADAESSTLFDHLNTMFRHRWLILGVLALTMSTAVLMMGDDAARFRSSARLMIEDEREVNATLIGAARGFNYYRDPEEYRQTQYRLLASSELAARVVARLDVQDPPPPPGRSYLERFVAELETRLGGSLETGPMAGGAARAAWGQEIAAGLNVEPVVNSRLVDVALSLPDAEIAKVALDTLLAEHLDLVVTLRRSNTEGTLEWLEEQVGRQRILAEDSDYAVTAFLESNNASSLRGENTAQRRLAQLNEALGAASIARSMADVRVRQVRGLEADLEQLRVADLGQVATDPGVAEAKETLARLEAELEAVARRYGPRHPTRQDVTASVTRAGARLVAEVKRAAAGVEAAYDAAALAEQNIKAQLEAQEQRMSALESSSAGYLTLQREPDSNRAVYDTLLQRAQEFRLAANSDATNVQIISQASVPFAIQPRGSGSLLFGAIVVWLLASAALVGVIEYCDDRLKTPNDLASVGPTRVLGVVPRMRGIDLIPIFDDLEPECADTYRALRRVVRFSMPGEDGAAKILVVTSTQPNEGKTVTSCILGAALARSGARVLVIDADLHRPSVHTQFRMDPQPGLSELLRGKLPPSKAILYTEEPHLSLIAAGEPRADAAELFEGNAIHAFFSSLRRQQVFEWVIIDTPPILAAADVLALAPLASGVVVVSRAGHTPRQQLKVALARLGSVPCRVTGTVFNAFDTRENRFHHHRYHGAYSENYHAQRVA